MSNSAERPWPSTERLLPKSLDRSNLFIGGHGYNILPASNGQEALDLAERHKEKIHLLLTDIIMPGMNGFELAKQAKDLFPEIKLLFMSGYDRTSADTDKTMQTSGNFIQKPIVLPALSVKLREILGK